MTIDVTSEQERRWARPPVEEAGPVRTVGGIFRTPEDRPSAHDGAPLVAAEDAVVAAVRLAYKVANAQLQRSTRLAKRLSKVGERAVSQSGDRKAVDPAEQFARSAMMNALLWLEAVAAEPDSPLMRLMIAQCKLLGSMLGMTPSDKSESKPPEPARRGRAKEPAAAEPNGGGISLGRVRIFLKGGVKRPVSLRRCEVASAALSDTVVRFLNVEETTSVPLEASFAVADDGQAKLTITTTSSAPPGRWKGAVCSEDDEQIGLIEIEL
jgi:hypothetical protein